VNVTGTNGNVAVSSDFGKRPHITAGFAQAGKEGVPQVVRNKPPDMNRFLNVTALILLSFFLCLLAPL